MKANEITRQQFALWSFERDLSVGCYEGKPVKIWAHLPKLEQDLYLEEAEFYLSQPVSAWPEDITSRLET